MSHRIFIQGIEGKKLFYIQGLLTCPTSIHSAKEVA